MTHDEADELVRSYREEVDDLIDEYASSRSDDYSRLPHPEQVSIEIRSLDYSQAIIDMAWEVISQSKSDFTSAMRGERSSEALTASYKVVAMRELLRQLLPIRNGPR